MLAGPGFAGSSSSNDIFSIRMVKYVLLMVFNLAMNAISYDFLPGTLIGTTLFFEGRTSTVSPGFA